MASFGEAVGGGFRNYATFGGRAARSDYWWWVLFTMIGYAAAGIVDSAVFEEGIGVVYGLFSLAVLLPGLAVMARRLHDGDRSGWWILIMFVPLVGFLLLLFWFVQRGTEGPNRFGEDPLAQAS